MSDLVAPSPDPRRASDADRDRVLKLLATATSDGRLTVDEHSDLMTKTLHARTLGELAVITYDLSPDTQGEPAQVVAPTGTPTRRGLFALLSARSRKGIWQVPTELRATAILGAIELDFRSAQFDAPEVVLVANTFLGAVEITVPDWVRVEDEGHVILGANEVHGAREVEGASPSQPTVTLRIRGVTVLGAVEVKRKAPKLKRQTGPELAGPTA